MSSASRAGEGAGLMNYRRCWGRLAGTMRYRGGNVAGVAVTRVAIGGPEFFAMVQVF
ncbi:PPE family protein [Mycobacterium tuberculosis variant bovis BCG str. ATCC 35743]|nr:PPE family protein [Mycobacterium tuberculosis variant bovis BCG str. ATCC 35743]